MGRTLEHPLDQRAHLIKQVTRHLKRYCRACISDLGVERGMVQQSEVIKWTNT